MFDAYKRFFRFAGEQKGSWYKGMAFELLRSIFEALQFAALLVVLRALVEQNMPGITHGWPLGSWQSAWPEPPCAGIWPTTAKATPITGCVRKNASISENA